MVVDTEDLDLLNTLRDLSDCEIVSLRDKLNQIRQERKLDCYVPSDSGTYRLSGLWNKIKPDSELKLHSGEAYLILPSGDVVRVDFHLRHSQHKPDLAYFSLEYSGGGPVKVGGRTKMWPLTKQGITSSISYAQLRLRQK